MKKELGIFLLLVALCAVTATINPRFLSQANLTNMANVIGLFGVLRNRRRTRVVMASDGVFVPPLRDVLRRRDHRN